MSKASIFAAILMLFLVNLVLKNRVPVHIVIPPPPPLPNPNARDYFIKACDLMKDADQIDKAYPTKLNGYKILLSPAQITHLVNENQDAIKMLRAGLKLPYQEPALRSYNASYPHYRRFRKISRLMSLEAKSLQNKRDWKNALSISFENIHMGTKIPTGGTLIGGLVGVAIEGIGRKSLQDTIPHLNAPTAKTGAKRIMQFVDHPIPLADILLEEKYTGQNTLMNAFNGLGKAKNSERGLKELFSQPQNKAGSGGVNVSKIADAVKFLWIGKAQIITNFSNYMDALIAYTKRPYALHLPPPAVPDDPINRIIDPVYFQAREKFVENESSNAILALNFAIQAYKMEHNNYPDQLELLVPAYLDHLPADPRALSGKYSYKKEKVGYSLRSSVLK